VCLGAERRVAVLDYLSQHCSKYTVCADKRETA
jgi:hypothetical protein